MNNIEIMKIIESKAGQIPLLVKPQLLEIYEAYETDINRLILKHNPVFFIDMLFFRMHESGDTDNRFSLLSKSLESGQLLSNIVTDFLSDNCLNSPFSSVQYDYEEFEKFINKESDDTIEIIIKDGGKEGKALIKQKPKTTFKRT